MLRCRSTAVDPMSQDETDARCIEDSQGARVRQRRIPELNIVA
jgi:hypothetical protein